MIGSAGRAAKGTAGLAWSRRALGYVITRTAGDALCGRLCVMVGRACWTIEIAARALATLRRVRTLKTAFTGSFGVTVMIDLAFGAQFALAVAGGSTVFGNKASGLTSGHVKARQLRRLGLESVGAARSAHTIRARGRCCGLRLTRSALTHGYTGLLIGEALIGGTQSTRLALAVSDQ